MRESSGADIVRRTMRVLVVEDEKKVAKALREGLEAEHYDVRVASSGEEGFFLVNHEAFECVVLDLMLPQRDRLDVLTTLRKRGLPTPVLILTAKDTIDDRVRGCVARDTTRACNDAKGEDAGKEPFPPLGRIRVREGSSFRCGLVQPTQPSPRPSPWKGEGERSRPTRR